MLAFLTGVGTTVQVIGAIGGALAAWKWVIKPLRIMFANIALIPTISDQLAVIGSLQDVVDDPMFITNPAGQFVSANLSCSRLLGWNVEELRQGGWRSKLDRDAQLQWDEAVEQKSLFERTLFIQTQRGRLRMRVLAKPIANGTKHLGWRGTIDRLGADQDDLVSAH